MFSKKEKPIGLLINQFLRQQGLEAPLQEYRLLAAWGEVAGLEVERVTRKLFVRNQTLVVELSSPVIRSEMMMRRGDLVRLLNDKAGAQVITDIMFR
jgi:hypothetical protein